jgi:hypothetical protein
MDTDPAAKDKVYLARSHREGEDCLRAYTDCAFTLKGTYWEVYWQDPHWSPRGKHTWSDAHSEIAVYTSNPLSCSLRNAGDMLDLAFVGNNVTIEYCPIADELIVYATRAIQKDEPIGITFGQEYC